MPTRFESPPLLDLDDPEVLRRLAEELHVSREEVIAAAALVGRMPKALRYYFSSKSRPLKKMITAADRARFDLIKLRRRPKRGPRTTFDGP